MKSPILSLALTALALTTSAKLSFADSLVHDPRDARIGGIVQNKETGEQIYLSCVEQNTNSQCIQYRFIAQLGSQTRVIGNQEVQPFELSSMNFKSKSQKFFRGKEVLPTLGWMADGFAWTYGDSQRNNFYDHANSMFASICPVTGLPGIGGVVLVGSATYDLVRLAVLLPVELVAKAFHNGKSKISTPFFTLLKDQARTKDPVSLSVEQFTELKNLVVQVSTAPVKP